MNPVICKGIILLNISLRMLHIKKQPWYGKPIIKSFQNLLRCETKFGLVAFFFCLSNFTLNYSIFNIFLQKYSCGKILFQNCGHARVSKKYSLSGNFVKYSLFIHLREQIVSQEIRKCRLKAHQLKIYSSFSCQLL